MRTAALEEGELDTADLGAGLLLDDLGKHGGKSAQLGMAEAIGGGGLGLGDKGAVGVVDALRHRDHALAGLVIDCLHIGDELLHVEIHLGQVDQIGAESGPGGQSGGTGQPAGMPAHDLDDGHHASVIDVGVMPDLHTGGGDILGGAGKAGAVVCAVEVVVDGLGDAHDAALVAHLLHILGDLVAGIHGVVAAVIEEITHIIFLEDLQNALIVRIVLVRVGKLIPAGA